MTKLAVEEARETAKRVLERVEASDIRLAALKLASQPPLQAGTLKVDISLNLAARYFGEGLICASRYELAASQVDETGESAEEPDRWTIEVEMHGLWRLNSTEGLSDTAAQAFTLAVGAMALHPYARSQIQATVAATGYPAFTMDIIGSLMEPGEDDLVDLSIVNTDQRDL